MHLDAWRERGGVMLGVMWMLVWQIPTLMLQTMYTTVVSFSGIMFPALVLKNVQEWFEEHGIKFNPIKYLWDVLEKNKSDPQSPTLTFYRRFCWCLDTKYQRSLQVLCSLCFYRSEMFWQHRGTWTILARWFSYCEQQVYTQHCWCVVCPQKRVCATVHDATGSFCIQ